MLPLSNQRKLQLGDFKKTRGSQDGLKETRGGNVSVPDRREAEPLQNPGEATRHSDYQPIWSPPGGHSSPPGGRRSPKLNISLLFTTKPHIELQKHQFLHAFVNLAPLNLTIIPLFTCYTPLFENDRKHHYLHAFVQRPKTPLFTLLWSAPQTPSHSLGPIQGCAQINLRENIFFRNGQLRNTMIYMLLDTSPTSLQNIDFYQVW